MRKRSVKSIKDTLINKSREAMIAAVQVYNNPSISFKTENYIVLASISWTYLLHAYYREIKVDYRYKDSKKSKGKYVLTSYGGYILWDLSQCLKEKKCPLDETTKTNIRFIIDLRNEIVHQMKPDIDEFVSAKIQACSINFNHYLCKLFGDKYNLENQLALSIQFSPIKPEQNDLLLNNDRLSGNIRNFIAKFEENLDKDTLCSEIYAYHVIFVPLKVNNENKADRVYELAKPDTEIGKDILKTYTVLKETEKVKYRAKEIVKMMQDEGYSNFNFHHHALLWKEKLGDREKHKDYCICYEPTWFWYETWIPIVREYCKKHLTPTQ
jgi:hypothetical protein